MHELTLWKKQEIDRLRKDMDSLFRRFRKEFGLPPSFLEFAETFSMDLSETESTLTVKAELPGIKPDDIHISVTDNTLTLKGETQEGSVEKSENYQRIERSSRSFSRTLTLPCRIKTEEVKATYKDNTLRIVLPKCAPKEARGVTVEIK
jgi:HSP20 family protein